MQIYRLLSSFALISIMQFSYQHAVPITDGNHIRIPHAVAITVSDSNGVVVAYGNTVSVAHSDSVDESDWDTISIANDLANANRDGDGPSIVGARVASRCDGRKPYLHSSRSERATISIYAHTLSSYADSAEPANRHFDCARHVLHRTFRHS